MNTTRSQRRLLSYLAFVCALAVCCAPIVPMRTKSGGSAHWALSRTAPAVLAWARDAVLVQVEGAGIGTDGWLPDEGGFWKFIFKSTRQDSLLEVQVNSDGSLRTKAFGVRADLAHQLPTEWSDSPRVWSRTRSHHEGTVVQTLDAELGYDIEPERYPGQFVWRIGFWLEEGATETHIVTPQGEWLGSYSPRSDKE